MHPDCLFHSLFHLRFLLHISAKKMHKKWIVKKSSGVWLYNLVYCKLMRPFSMGEQYYNSLCRPCGIVGQRGITEDGQSRSRWHSTSPNDTDMYMNKHIWQGQVQVQMAETSTTAAELSLVQHLVGDTSRGGALVGMGWNCTYGAEDGNDTGGVIAQLLAKGYLTVSSALTVVPWSFLCDGV